MKKNFVILNLENTKSKNKIFNVCVKLKTNSKVYNTNLNIKLFDKTKQFLIVKKEQKRSLKTNIIIESSEPETNNVSLFNTTIYGFDKSRLDNFNDFIKNNIAAIIENINILYQNFNEKNECYLTLNDYSLFRILRALNVVGANSLLLFKNIELENLYPEIFKVEGAAINGQ